MIISNNYYRSQPISSPPTDVSSCASKYGRCVSADSRPSESADGAAHPLDMARGWEGGGRCRFSESRCITKGLDCQVASHRGCCRYSTRAGCGLHAAALWASLFGERAYYQQIFCPFTTRNCPRQSGSRCGCPSCWCGVFVLSIDIHGWPAFLAVGVGRRCSCLTMGLRRGRSVAFVVAVRGCAC